MIHFTNPAIKQCSVSRWYGSSPSFFRVVFGTSFTCALCPRQWLLVMPCQDAAVVFRAGIQLHITRQLKENQKKAIQMVLQCKIYHFLNQEGLEGVPKIGYQTIFLSSIHTFSCSVWQTPPFWHVWRLTVGSRKILGRERSFECRRVKLVTFQVH